MLLSSFSTTTQKGFKDQGWLSLMKGKVWGWEGEVKTNSGTIFLLRKIWKEFRKLNLGVQTNLHKSTQNFPGNKCLENWIEHKEHKEAAET